MNTTDRSTDRTTSKTTDTNRIQAVGQELAGRLQVVVTSLPDLATKSQVLTAVERVGQALASTEEATGKLRYLLGKAMIFVQEKELYKPEHERFEDWRLSLADRLHISRATVSKCPMLARSLPDTVDLDTIGEIPLTNIELVARVAHGLKPAKINRLLESAKKSNVIEFKAKLEKDGLIRGGPKSGLVSIVIKVKPAVAKAWKRIGDADEFSEWVMKQRTRRVA